MQSAVYGVMTWLFAQADRKGLFSTGRQATRAAHPFSQVEHPFRHGKVEAKVLRRNGNRMKRCVSSRKPPVQRYFRIAVGMLSYPLFMIFEPRDSRFDLLDIDRVILWGHEMAFCI